MLGREIIDVYFENNETRKQTLTPKCGLLNISIPHFK
jgi:hypothetical protein